MKVVQINTFPNKSTGTIMMNIHRALLDNNIESYVVWGRGRKSNNEYEIVIEDNIGVKLHGVYTRITDKTGFASKKATKELLKKLDSVKPDIIHLHNIHGYYLNIEMLFNYIRKNNIKIIWTLHDCWTFTGHCAYFDMVGCEKWKTGCYKCNQKTTYPSSYLKDNSKWNWKKKKELFTGLNINIVTPSRWLSKEVKESFLAEYNSNVIYNGIDLDIFKPIDVKGKIKIKEKYDLIGKRIILGVASEWTERKGLKDFVELSKISKNKYKIILVGLNKKQLKHIPENIIGFTKTNNVRELVELYSIADIFVNPTYEDNFPTTNIEALACGTPIITYNTGGSMEVLENMQESRKIGKILSKIETKPSILNVRLLNEEIINFLKDIENNKYIERKCISVALNFNKDLMLKKYLDLYDWVDKNERYR